METIIILNDGSRLLVGNYGDQVNPHVTLTVEKQIGEEGNPRILAQIVLHRWTQVRQLISALKKPPRCGRSEE